MADTGTFSVRVDLGSGCYVYDTVQITKILPCPILLPIELLNFDAIKKGKMTKLNWSTETEINNDYFIIERITDKGLMTEVGSKIKGAGNSTKQLNYEFWDEQPSMGNNYYRLKQVDYDGKYTYSSLRLVNFTEPTTASLLVSPNPSQASERIQIDVSGFYSNEKILLVLRDVRGVEVYSKSMVSSTQGNIHTMISSGENLAPGMYLVIATSNDKLLNQKIIVE